MSSSTDSNSTEEPGRFAVAEMQGDRCLVLGLSGELDHDTAPALREAADRSLATLAAGPAADGGTGRAEGGSWWTAPSCASAIPRV